MLSELLLAMVVQLPASTPPPVTPPTPEAQAQDHKPWPPEGVFRMAQVTPPRLRKEVKPVYTADAMRARVQGVVALDAIVGTDGKVGEVRVKRSLDREHGLDEQALNAVKQWEFLPATKDGVAVPVLVEIEMSFVTGDQRRGR